jgi:hypothetical protein
MFALALLIMAPKATPAFKASNYLKASTASTLAFKATLAFKDTSVSTPVFQSYGTSCGC